MDFDKQVTEAAQEELLGPSLGLESPQEPSPDQAVTKTGSARPSSCAAHEHTPSGTCFGALALALLLEDGARPRRARGEHVVEVVGRGELGDERQPRRLARLEAGGRERLRRVARVREVEERQHAVAAGALAGWRPRSPAARWRCGWTS